MADNRTKYERTHHALKAQLNAVENGRWPFSIPFGYKKVLRGYKESINKDSFSSKGFRVRKIPFYDLEVDNKNAAILKELFQMYATEFYSYEFLGEFFKNKYNIIFSNSNLQKIFQNKFYIGEMHYKGNIYHHSYGNIIDNDLFEKVTSIKSEKRKYVLPLKNDFCYRQLIICFICKTRTLTPEKHKSFFYYHCNNKKNHIKTLHTKEQIFTHYFIDLISSIVINEKYLISLPNDLSSRFNFFIENLKKLFTEQKLLRKRILKLITKNIYWDGKTITYEFKAPFEGSIYQDFTWFDLDEIIKNFYEEKSLISYKIEDTLPKKIIIYCVKPLSTNQLLELLAIDLNELQSNLLDLQLEGKIEQNEFGYWKIK